MELSVGIESKGLSKIKDIGSKKITDQINVEVVTFMFPDFFKYFRIIIPEIE